jgi:hypothetical protein
MLFLSFAGWRIALIDIRCMAAPRCGRTFPRLTIIVLHVSYGYPMKLQPLAEILPVYRFRYETRSVGAAQYSQGFLAGRVNIENFLKIEDVAVAAILAYRDAKQFLCPQAGQLAL